MKANLLLKVLKNEAINAYTAKLEKDIQGYDSMYNTGYMIALETFMRKCFIYEGHELENIILLIDEINQEYEQDGCFYNTGKRDAANFVQQLIG